MVDAARPELHEANKAQKEAASPRGSRIASANAGSGKTKVLVDRVTRLLIGGTKPDKILCLTYTKAAANEMQNRLFETLGSWSVLSKDKLNTALNDLLGGDKQRSESDIAHARRLFANALETPEGLKVQTIHAFCERVLGRFPIEAGIQPGYDPIDEVDIKSIRKTVETQIYQKAWNHQDGDLARAIQLMASARADQTLETLFDWMAGKVDEIKTWQASGGIDALADKFGLPSDADPDSVKRSVWDATDKDNVRAAAEAMLGGLKTDQKYGAKILSAFGAADPIAAFDLYASGLMTKNSLRVSPVTKNGPQLARDMWGTKEDIRPESERVLKAFHDVLAAQILVTTRAIYTIAAEFIEGYEAEKRRLRGLDFNDQIFKVRDLLTDNEQSAWVQYKLDGGVEHILVDEAQDTAPNQWTIIDKLKEAFEPPDPALIIQDVKTFFAVGDEKQSIYSFQGAKPEAFITRMGDMTEESGTNAVRMEMSFRSSPDILRFVDAVLNDCCGIDRMFDEKIVANYLEPVAHTAFRQDHGLVELWPLAPKAEEDLDENAWDTRPVDTLSQASSREQLARQIAEQIKTWLKIGEPVFQRDKSHESGGYTRPMRPEDILILVRSRSAFFDAVIRNLKDLDVPVAGADRLVIADSVVVKDLLALTRFVLLPDDDLALAEVLRSPLIDLSEDQLFEVCYGREKQSVWESLKSSDAEFAKTAAMNLTTMIGFSRQYAPFEFYRRVLDVLAPSGESRLKAVYHRLSMEAQDALEAFLNRALAHQRQCAPSLQHFLNIMSGDNQDIKREMDSAQGEVRVMTVHGAKGLEAPVVILPDTTQMPRSRNSESPMPLGDGWVYIPSTDSTPDDLKGLTEQAKARQTQEYMRLLYVAMTRAESRLVVCGFHSGSGAEGKQKGCWYDEVSAAMEKLPFQIEALEWGEKRIFGARAKPYETQSEKGLDENIVLPRWTKEAAPEELPGRRHVTPSHLLAAGEYAEVPVRSPLSQSVDRFRRGNLTHKLLEILPDIAADRRRNAAQAFLAQHKDIPDAVRASIEDEVMTVLEHPDYAPFFAPGSFAEVNLAGQGKGLPADLRLNAQIDRLAVTDETVYIVDYKSNRPPPDIIDDVPEIYWGQMAAYREMIKLTHPGKAIVCALLWTDGPSLMIMPEDGLDVALTRIGAVPT